MAEGEKAPPSASYADALGKATPTINDKSTSFATTQTRNPLSQFKGEPAMFITEEEEERLARTFQWTLVAKFSWGRPALALIRKEVLAVGFLGDCKVGLFDSRHILFKFDKEEDYQRFWSRKIWHFQGFQARIFKWSPDFDPAVEPSITPVWIRFPSLPLHLYHKEKLYTLASLAGTPLKLDAATAGASDLVRPSEARVCVEMDLTKSIPNRIWIGTKEKGRWQSLEIEDKPDYCSTCRKMGHESKDCDPLRNRAPKRNKASLQAQVKKKSEGKQYQKEWIMVSKRPNNQNQNPPVELNKGKEVDPTTLPILCLNQDIPESSGQDIAPAGAGGDKGEVTEPEQDSTEAILPSPHANDNHELGKFPMEDKVPSHCPKGKQEESALFQKIQEQSYCDIIMSLVTEVFSSEEVQGYYNQMEDTEENNHVGPIQLNRTEGEKEKVPEQQSESTQKKGLGGTAKPLGKRGTSTGTTGTNSL